MNLMDVKVDLLQFFAGYISRRYFLSPEPNRTYTLSKSVGESL